MSKVLIYCLPGDFHVVAVRWGLAQLGAECVMWYPGDLPDYQSASFEFADGAMSVRIQSTGCEPITFDDVGAVWNRRYPRPVAPEWVNKADTSMVEEQCYQHMQGLRHCVSDRVFTVNDPCVEVNASKKLLQIKIAAESGFLIPDTLATNDPAEVGRFWARKEGRVVVKSFVGAAWESGKGVHSFYATLMPEPGADLADAIRSAPYIYQEALLDRDYDVRLIYIDGEIFACSIKAATPDRIDIRRDIAYRIAEHERIPVPDAVAAAVRQYCDRLDMRYGAFDFIVDNDGRWWFLECNSAGQFLWLETQVPGIGLLDAFCKMFLRHMGRRVDEGLVVTVSDFRASGVWEAEQASWPGPHKPGMIISGYRQEDEGDLALLS